VVFVVDSTSNLLYQHFQLYVLGTIADVIRHLDVDLGRTRVAAVQFTNIAKVSMLYISFLFVIDSEARCSKTRTIQPEGTESLLNANQPTLINYAQSNTRKEIVPIDLLRDDIRRT